jgi:hypothetical protein
MTTPRRKKDVCSTCGTMAGVLSCRGCTGHFCVPHSKEHRELLQRSMNEITHNYDELKKKIQRQTSEQQQHSLAEQIDQWEQESIEKIRQLANDTRQEIKTTVQHRTDHLKEKLEKLKQQLDKARRDGGFYENDLKQWSDKLQELQRSFIDQPKIKLDEDSLSTPLVSRISLNETSRILLSSSSSSLFPTDSEHETAQYQNYLLTRTMIIFQIRMRSHRGTMKIFQLNTNKKHIHQENMNFDLKLKSQKSILRFYLVLYPKVKSNIQIPRKIQRFMDGQRKILFI